MPPSPENRFQGITFYQTRIIVVITLLLGLASSFYIALLDYRRLNEEFQNTVEQIVSSIENSTANAVYTYNNNLAEEIVNGLFRFEPIISVSIVDDSELALAEATKQTKTDHQDETLLSRFFDARPQTIHKPLYHLNRDDVSQQIGTLKIVVTPRHMVALFSERLINHLIGTLVFTTILSVVLIILFQRLLAAPLVKLARVFSSFDVHHPDSSLLPNPEDFPNNEFRTVVSNGRKMLEIIKSNMAELESRVADRTASLQKLTQAIEQSPTMMYIVNSDTEIEYANARFYSFTGFTPAEVIGKNPKILSSGKTSPLVYEDLWKTIKAGDVWKHQIEDRKKDGCNYWASITIAPIHDPSGTITHYLCAQEDITERVVAHQNLQKARDEAERANKSKSEFLSNMSHELRTPLNAILGFAQLLEAGRNSPLTEKQKSQVEQILKGGNHLLELINEVLELSKIEAGKLGLSIEPTDADDLIEDCIAFASTIAEKRSIIVKDCSNEPKPMLMVDGLRTKQIVMNLLSNAIKYNRDGGSVWVSGEQVDDLFFRISVVDTGYGIPEDRQVELFKPFSRLGAEGSAIEGTGIGLALSKKLVEAMGGKIGFSCIKDTTSTFWCDFPTAKHSTSAAQISKTEKPLPSFHSKNGQEDRLLLYVEDNPTNLALMENVIEDIQHLKMISAHTAEFGLELAEQEQPDVILLDINLPGMDGIEAVKRLKTHEKTRQIPVIALSANAMKETIKQAILAGFDDYLTKPLKIHKFYQVVESLLPAKRKH